MLIGGPGTISLQAYTPPATARARATKTVAMTLRTPGSLPEQPLSPVSKERRTATLKGSKERPHHRPLAEEIRVEAGIRERADPTLHGFPRGLVPDGIPQERGHVELRLADHRLRIDDDPAVAMAQQVVVVEVAMDE